MKISVKLRTVSHFLTVLIAFFALLSCHAPVHENSVAEAEALSNDFGLRINDVSGLDEPWPMIGGLPFPEGEFYDASQIRIVDSEGHEIPAQIDVVATWKDGSIRWAHAGINADPQGDYRVEFGPGVSRSEHDITLQVRKEDNGAFAVHTGKAVYEFLPNRLLPESGKMGDNVVLEGSGDGAYLIDNRGRPAYVAGEAAEIETEFLKEGPGGTVIRREGWYVSREGEQVARARMWFYFTAGSPFVRMTHSIIFTEDTNELWIRDYGLAFRTPETPQSAAFALEGTENGSRIEETLLEHGEVYMLQDTYPHFFRDDSRAVVARGGGDVLDGLSDDEDMARASFWNHYWLAEGEVAGDWADARFENYGLTVVMPNLARRFPKEIAVAPDGVRAAFWSGRSGRELDFRTHTLVDEYWQDYARRAPGGPVGLARRDTNAQGAARTHDLWLLPRVNPTEQREKVQARAKTASDPPLLQSDPVWLTGTKAVGWTMHPKDVERFPEQEDVIVKNYWEQQETRRVSKNFNGFIDWGRHDTIRGLGQFFRLSHLVDYGLRTHIWGLYARSGERSYYDYGSGFNRFAGDLEMANWDTPNKNKGGFTLAESINLPFYWGNRTTLVAGVTGDDIGNWKLEYYLTGDAYAADRVDMQAEAFRQHWSQDDIPRRIQQNDGGFAIVRRLMRLYEWAWDDTFAEWAGEWIPHLIDFDVPNAITDEIRHGPLYKTDRNLFYLSYYYKVTGDETAKKAFLQSLDYKYRLRRFRGAFGAQAYPAMLYSLAYRWTGNPNYLRVVNYIMQMGLEMESASIHSNMHPTQSVPAGLAALAKVDEPIDPFPVVTWFSEPDSTLLMVRQSADQGEVLRCALRMEEPFEDPAVELSAWREGRAEDENLSGLRIERELAFQPSSGSRADPHSWHVQIELPDDLPGDLYLLNFPGASHVHVLESSASETSVYAPEGFRVTGDRLKDFFRVDAETEPLRLFLGVPMTIYRPDGTVALEVNSDMVGEQGIPVEGHAGVWSVRASQSGVIRLFNAQPLFSRSPQWLVTGAEAEPEQRFEPPTDDRAFVPGPDGLALHLPDGEYLRYERGGEVNDHFEYFPGSEGAVEFWFRPNWSSTDLPFPGGRSFTDRYFLRAGSHSLQYRRGRDRSGEVASLNLWAYGRETNAGFTGQFPFEAGEWYHVAFTWQTFDGEPGTEGHYAVYINGQPVEADSARPGGQYGSAHYWPGRVNGALPFYRRKADEKITIGPMDGTLAQLRISDTVRYTEPFTPTDGKLEADENTLVLFPLDGDKGGITPEKEEIELKN